MALRSVAGPAAADRARRSAPSGATVVLASGCAAGLAACGSGRSGNRATGAGLTSNSGVGGAGGDGGDGGAGSDGGAIEVATGASSLLNVTTDANQVGPGGSGGSTGGSGGVEGLGGGLYAQSATSDDDMVLRNTIVADSRGGANCAGTSFSAITDSGHDLNFPDTTCPGTNGDPKLLSLSNFGGPTETLGLASGSAAIDQVPATGADCPAIDQRGVNRPQGSACDIGAFELTTPQITITSPTDGASYRLDSTVLAAYSCSEGEITSPIATCNGTVPNGQPIDTSSTGTKSFTLTATDKAGNQTTKTVNYTITASTRSSAIRSSDHPAAHRSTARPSTHGVRPADRRPALGSSLGRAEVYIRHREDSLDGDAKPHA